MAKRWSFCSFWGWLLLLPALGLITAPPSEASAPVEAPTELYFDYKLLYRGRMLGVRADIDQWAGARLLMTTDPGDGTGARQLSLLRPLEDPWVFRWYPGKGEVKLGAAIAVESPDGHPYGSLAPDLTQLAQQKHAEWWNGDAVQPLAAASPDWQPETEQFWSEQHQRETAHALATHPVYPFHVLGEVNGRLRFQVDRNGAVGGVIEEMSSPWLATGWQQWQDGRQLSGYGYWERERPRWEPRTYEALDAGLQLLSWSPWPEGSADQRAGLEPGAMYVRKTGGGDGNADLLRGVVALVETLNPRFAGRIGWRGPLSFRFQVVQSAAGGPVVVVGQTRKTPIPGQRYIQRAWRLTWYDRASARILHDEIQLLSTDPKKRQLKLWVRLGYRLSP